MSGTEGIAALGGASVAMVIVGMMLVYALAEHVFVVWGLRAARARAGQPGRGWAGDLVRLFLPEAERALVRAHVRRVVDEDRDASARQRARILARSLTYHPWTQIVALGCALVLAGIEVPG
ncbi:MAG: hypothetical protein AAFR52_17005 [Pseudomonadota bacterium]